MGTEAALVFTTGYQANVGCIGTILGPGDTVICDSGDHASILDGCRLSGAKLRPFRHNRIDKLERMLERAAGDGGGVLVVVDGVFSMEGDIAPLTEIVELCRPLRRPPDGRRGPRRRRARRPRGGRQRAARGRGLRRPANGHLLEELRLLRRLHRRPGGGDRLPADRGALVPVQRRGGPGSRRRGIGGPADHPLRGSGADRQAARQCRLSAPRPDRPRPAGRRSRPRCPTAARR